MTASTMQSQIRTDAARGAAKLAPIRITRSMPRLVTPASVPERRTRRKATQLYIPKGKPDLKALMVVIDDWLVPLLVKDFLAEYRAKAASGGTESTKTDVPQERKKAHAKL